MFKVLWEKRDPRTVQHSKNVWSGRKGEKIVMGLMQLNVMSIVGLLGIVQFVLEHFSATHLLRHVSNFRKFCYFVIPHKI